jgi:hypothetical protein
MSLLMSSLRARLLLALALIAGLAAAVFWALD